MCQTCGGKTWIGEPWSPDTCPDPDCTGVIATNTSLIDDDPWGNK